MRYPQVTGQAHGKRCPVCAGNTRVVYKGDLIRERSHSFSLDSSRPTDAFPKPKGFGEDRGGGFSVLLDNVRSAWNVGSMLRTAEGFRFMHAYLCGITPTPENNAVQKTSLGAEDSVPWSYHKDAVRLAKGLKFEGWKIFALEEDANAAPLKPIQKTNVDSVLIVGNEISGVDPELLSLCDRVFYIPMRGEKKSFNAAVAFGIAAYTLHASD